LASSPAAIVSLLILLIYISVIEAIYAAKEGAKALPGATLKTKQPFGILI